MKITKLIYLFFILYILFCMNCLPPPYGPNDVKKPVIYLYPEKKVKVNVTLKYQGKLLYTYPTYNDGWKITANPDGTIINSTDNLEYSYLFWEGRAYKKDWNIDKGFIVKGVDTKIFLQKILPKFGLIPKEYNEFIVYWFPILEKNEYNLISFAGSEYTELAKLDINPKPDSILRVFMLYKPVKNKIIIEEQKIIPFERKGFSVIEWGGTQIK